MKLPAQAFTHGGKFHADDVFSAALLRHIRPDIRILRGFAVPENFDGLVFDIGDGMFDHHAAGSPVRPNGNPYAAFGLLWQAPSWWAGTARPGWTSGSCRTWT